MDRTRLTKKINYDVIKFLRCISEPGELRYFFIKARKNNTASNFCGYYEESRFNQLAKDIKSFDGEASGIYYAINSLKRSRLEQVENSLQVTAKIKSPKTADIFQRRLLLVDIDPIRQPDCSASADEKLGAEDVARQVYRDLKQAGWPTPIVVDSGNGYHLLYRIDLPANDGGIVRACLKALASNYDNEKIKIDTDVHDAVRLAKLPGTLACKGHETPERPHRRSGFFQLPVEFKTVPQALLTELAAQAPQESTKQDPVAHHPIRKPNVDVIARARAYLAKMEPAISGEHGRNQFFNAACRLVDDFALSTEQARPLLAEYNQRCLPPFNDLELDDKLSSASAKVTQRGGPTGSAISIKKTESPSPAKRFRGHVPDFGLVATIYVLIPISLTPPSGLMIYLFYLWNRQHSHALVPDLMLRQLFFGASYDRNWRARLPKKVKLRQVKNNRVCNADRCIFHATGIKHRHYAHSLRGYPILESFCRQEDSTPAGPIQFRLYEEDFREHRTDLQKKGILFNVYWPALLLGGSPKVGWTWPQQRLVVGLVRELTRTKTKPGEGITGEIIQGAFVAPVITSSRMVLCPILDQKSEYVTFAGNGRRKGRGYQIVGRTGKGWLFRAGYIDAPKMDNKQKLEATKSFLTDLYSLSKELGLVPVGVYQGEWKSIDQMMDCLRNGWGQDWLDACTLRVFAPADWRQLWRRHFSEKLGFDWIPETPEDTGPDVKVQHIGRQGGFTSAHEIRSFLKEQEWSQKKLAEEITKTTGRACSVRRVERHLGKPGPRREFLEDVDAVRDQLREHRRGESQTDS